MVTVGEDAFSSPPLLKHLLRRKISFRTSQGKVGLCLKTERFMFFQMCAGFLSLSNVTIHGLHNHINSLFDSSQDLGLGGIWL